MKVSSGKYRKDKGRTRDTRTLHLKIRVRITRPMSVARARQLLERAVASGVVPSGIEVRWIDWSKGTGGRANSGRLDEPVFNELRAWYGAITKGDTRFARVRREGER